MNTDSYFTKGHGHKTCQDYAINGETQNFVYAIITDGCTDSRNSDVGARMIAHAFVNGLERHLKANNISTKEQLEASNAQYSLGVMMQMQVLYSLPPIQQHTGLSDKSFNATFVAVLYSKLDAKLYLFVWGDGFVFLNYDDKKIVREFSYDSNAPYYISYLACQQEQAYLKEFGTNKAKIIETIENVSGEVSKTNGELEPYYCSEIPQEGLKFIGVASDGLGTYADDAGNSISSLDIVKKISDYKSTIGEFVQRKMTKLEKDFTKDKVNHFDDISVAVINFQ